jgi:thiamine pyrophosphate-dependent acetolactate synthase large subunit-like protein
VPTGALNPMSIAHALAAAMPENCIVVDESLTTGRESMGYTMGARPHDLINNMGGSIGYGTPVATGAALACPDRRTFCMVGDGSAMYTIQSLWTQAREGLPVTTIIFANNSYAILKAEYANMGAGTPGPQAMAMIDIDNPTHRLGGDGQEHGCPRCAGRHRRGLLSGNGAIGTGAGPLADRGEALLEHVLIRLIRHALNCLCFP